MTRSTETYSQTSREQEVRATPWSTMIKRVLFFVRPPVIVRPVPLICQLSSGHSVGDERILHRMARTASQQGYRSAFVVPHDGKATCDGVTLVACPKTEVNGARWRRWTASFDILLWALRSDGNLFQIHDPDMLPAGLILKLFGRRIIYDVHDDYEASFKDRLRKRGWLGRWFPSLWWWFERNTVRAFDGVVVADRHLAKKFARYNPVILGNYPRLDFTPAAQADNEETFNLIYVGGVTRERGLEMALKALRLLPMQNLRLHIIGAGREPDLIEMLQADSRVVMHGRIDWTELNRHYIRSHVGLALYQPLESFYYCPGENAVKVIEYMAAGIPVLCSDFPGLRAFVEDAGCGVVVQPDDPQAIAAKIRQLAEDDNMRGRMGATGRRLFESEYNWEKHEHKLADLYRRILER